MNAGPRAELNEIDSAIFGKTVLELRGVTADMDFRSFEEEYARISTPWYACCKVPAHDIPAVHMLEENGFRFMELQLRLSFRVKPLFEKNPFPQYVFEEVTDTAILDRVIEIATGTFTDDRISNDPLLGPAFAKRRYAAYLERSFTEPNQRLYAMINSTDGDIVGFKSHLYLPGNEVQLLLGGLRNDCKNSGLAPLLEHFEFCELAKNGIKRGQTAVSGRNMPIINLEIAGFGFKVKESMVVMRKLYNV